MKNKEMAWYNTVFDEQNNCFIKTDKISGKSWKWPYKDRLSRKNPTVSSNGVTLQKLAKANYKVRIRHFRYASYNPGDSFNFRELFKTAREIIVPSTFRNSPYYKLAPKGGFTHITIRVSDKDYICLSSECSKKDPFCYNTGIAVALSRISGHDLARLSL